MKKLTAALVVLLLCASCGAHKVADPVVQRGARHTTVSVDSGPIELSIVPEQTMTTQGGGVDVIYAVVAKNLHDADDHSPPVYVGVTVAVNPPQMATAQPGEWQFQYGTDCTDSTQAPMLWPCPQAGDIGRPENRGFGFGCTRVHGSLWEDAQYDVKAGCLIFGFRIAGDVLTNDNGTLVDPLQWRSIHEWDTDMAPPGQAVVGRFRCMAGLGVKLVSTYVACGGTYQYVPADGGSHFVGHEMLSTLGSVAVVARQDTSRTPTVR